MRPRIFLSLFLFFCSALGKAQVTWFAKGQVFRYEVTTGWNQKDYGIHTISFDKDTLVNNQPIKVLEYLHVTGGKEKYYVSQDGDKIYGYTYDLKKATLLYNFDAVVGDSTSIIGTLIKSIGKTTFAGKELRYQIWEDFTKNESLVIEGIGLVGNSALNDKFSCSPLFPNWGCRGFVDGNNYYFRCFSDGNYIFDPYNICVSSSQNLNLHTTVKVFPNPNQGVFSIEGIGDVDFIQVTDLLGKAVAIIQNQNGQYDLPSNMPHGIYFVSGFKRQSRIFNTKMILNRE